MNIHTQGNLAYRIKLDNFEGPLDLLLFFIQRDRINVYDIPIAYIITEFMEYIDLMKMLNIRIAGEFIVMAAMLMQIKAKMLIPREKMDDLGIEDPRVDLVQRLLEYKQIKVSALDLDDLQNKHSYKYAKGIEIPFEDQKENPADYLKGVSLFELLSVFKEVMDKLPEGSELEVSHEPVHLDDQIHFIRTSLTGKKKVSFIKLISRLESKLKVIVTFMAILEMLRSKELYLFQEKPFGDILLSAGIEI